MISFATFALRERPHLAREQYVLRDAESGRPLANVRYRMRIQPVDATHLKLHSSKECCNETETADLLYRQPEGVNVGALA
ncbi:hypothetical protein, partial [Burkholderia stagnalis]|uniref:hypothetical protein n=1 Tax=Burkholderia stagnalis TaxID=1503054 RepID=UPI0039BEFE0D